MSGYEKWWDIGSTWIKWISMLWSLLSIHAIISSLTSIDSLEKKHWNRFKPRTWAMLRQLRDRGQTRSNWIKRVWATYETLLPFRSYAFSRPIDLASFELAWASVEIVTLASTCLRALMCSWNHWAECLWQKREERNRKAEKREESKPKKIRGQKRGKGGKRKGKGTGKKNRR